MLACRSLAWLACGWPDLAQVRVKIPKVLPSLGIVPLRAAMPAYCRLYRTSFNSIFPKLWSTCFWQYLTILASPWGKFDDNSIRNGLLESQGPRENSSIYFVIGLPAGLGNSASMKMCMQAIAKLRWRQIAKLRWRHICSFEPSKKTCTKKALILEVLTRPELSRQADWWTTQWICQIGD